MKDTSSSSMTVLRLTITKDCMLSCPTLCDPLDCSPPGSSIHGIFQARILEWVAISFSRGSSWPRDQTWVSCVSCINWQILLPLLLLLLSCFSCVRLYATPWTVACQAPLSIGSRVPCPPSGDLPNPRIEPASLMSSALAGRFFTTSATWEAIKGQKVGSSLSSVQFSSVSQSCLTLCNPMTRSTPGLPVHHQLPEFTQTHIHWVSDAIQPSHPLLSPSPLAPNPSQHQSLFQWVNSSHEVAKVLEFQL